MQILTLFGARPCWNLTGLAAQAPTVLVRLTSSPTVRPRRHHCCAHFTDGDTERHQKCNSQRSRADREGAWVQP